MSKTVYDIRPVKAPTSAGTLLRVLVELVENPLGGALLGGQLLGSVGVLDLRHVPVEEPPTFLPPVFAAAAAARQAEPAGEGAELSAHLLESDPSQEFRMPSAGDYRAAYDAGRLDPVQVAELISAGIQASDAAAPPLRGFIAHRPDDLRQQALESAERLRRGEPRGPLEGVPVAVKDELDQLPYPTTVGTRFLGQHPAPADAEVVARLRAAGALLIGKANMHEIGLGVTGLNPHHGTPRNPYSVERVTGGSSSGSGAVVGAGLCPIAVGADGGGSIRIPASFCGVFGLKATFGRISEHGAAPLCWSLAHVGPLAANASDLALAYGVMAGADPKDPHSTHQPNVRLPAPDATDLSGVRLGVFTPWFEDADAGVVAACRSLLDELVAAGAEVREVTIPELGLLRTVHLVTIVSEMLAAHLQYAPAHRRHYGHETRLNLALGSRLRSSDYTHAQRFRTRLCAHFERALQDVHAIITPTTGITAPPVNPRALATGASDLGLTTRIMRFAQAANLTGLPALSVPAGYDDLGLPVGLQAMGRPWSEDLLLRLAYCAQQALQRRKPTRWHAPQGVLP